VHGAEQYSEKRELNVVIIPMKEMDLMSGKTVTVAENRIVIGSEKLPLISGEFHYWRNAKSNWSQILQTCKSMGFRILSTYVAWSYHELEPGPSISPPILACRARADALPCVLSPATHTKETPPAGDRAFTPSETTRASIR